MGKSSRSDPPPAPDPYAVASAQGAQNREAAIASARLNQVDEVTPWGSSTYSPTGDTVDGIDRWQRVTTIDPADKAMLDKQREIGLQLYGYGGDLLNRVQGSTSEPFDFAGLPDVAGMDEGARSKVEDALYSRATSRLDPRWEQDQTRLETQLANQGFARDSEAWKNAMADFGRQKNDAYESARLGAEAQGVSEQGRLFGLESTARQNALAEEQFGRSLPLQELQALMGTAPAINTPQFSAMPTSGVAPADITSPTAMAYQGSLNNYNAQQSANNAMTGSVLGLGGQLGAAYLLSDPDMKTDREPIDEDSILSKIETLPVEAWRYIGDGKKRIGPMADDFAERFGGDGSTIDIPTMFGVNIASIKALSDRVRQLENA